MFITNRPEDMIAIERYTTASLTELSSLEASRMRLAAVWQCLCSSPLSFWCATASRLRKQLVSLHARSFLSSCREQKTWYTVTSSTDNKLFYIFLCRNKGDSNLMRLAVSLALKSEEILIWLANWRNCPNHSNLQWLEFLDNTYNKINDQVAQI